MTEQPDFYTNINGDKTWYLPSKGRNYLHRINGPAVEWADGTTEWWINDKRHRLDGPAYEDVTGTKEWWINDERHRIDCQLCSCSKAGGRCVCDGHIHSNGPAVEFDDGSKHWYVNGKRHRINGPAVEWANGTKEWWINDERHRLDGPAYEDVNGTKEWWINNSKLFPIKEVELWIKENNINLETEAGQMIFKLRWL